jgi:hypothetical protein
MKKVKLKKKKIKKAKALLEESKKTYQKLSGVVKKETIESSKERMTKVRKKKKFKSYFRVKMIIKTC